MPACWENLPPEFIERVRNIIDADQLDAVLEAFCHKRLTTLRANTLKISPEELQKEFTSAGIEIEQQPWWPTAFLVKNKTLREITEHPLHPQGAVYIQSFSSMIPPLVLDPQPGEHILDLTAAPGSKTTQIAALMNNTGEILANDLSPVRLFRLSANLKMQGVTIAYPRRGPGQLFWKKYPEYFDRTLVDVPCTMEGRICAEDPKTYADWSKKKIKELSVRQCHLLRSAVSATKVGGIIVYSTCTLAPEENENVINWILKREGDGVVVEDIDIPHLAMTSGLAQWQKKTFSPQVLKTRRILPSPTMEGFFVAKLRKTRSTISY